MGASASDSGRRRSDGAILAAALLTGLALALTPIGGALDRAISPLRFGLVHRMASGRVAIVEMDAQSAAAIQRWPWSRRNYAAVVDNLRAAGAATIVFDVDFSSPSDAAGDQAFAKALARADGLVALPTFGQNAASGEQRVIDALPIPLLRPHVALASVSIQPDRDGQVRSMPFGTVTAGLPRPSLSAFIAQRSGAAGTAFPIDFSIAPATIPRLSFIDVRDGRFDPRLLRGRNVLIGATAIEMGDRYGTPGWGVIPGVVVQALAAETLLQGAPSYGSATVPLLLALGCAVAIVTVRSGVRIGAAILGGLAAVIGFCLAAQYGLLVTYPLAPALGMVVLAGFGAARREIAGRFHRQRTIDEATGLPNARSLLAEGASAGDVTLAVAQIGNHDSLLAVLGSGQMSDVVVRTAERLTLVAQERRVYRIADRQLAVLLPAGEPIEDMLDGLRAILLQPIEVGGRRVDVNVTIGVAAGTADGLERLLVDAALAADDALRGDAFWRRRIADESGLELSITLMGELDAALAAGQIDVFYQPKFHLRQGRITSVEALVRWNHPSRGFVGPDLFIPMAEKTNRIAPLTLYVLRRVVRDLTAWRVQYPDVTAAVNISAKLLSAVTFNAEVEQILADTGVPPAALVFEVTESAAMADPASAIAALERYRDLQIAVSMDDYGTGQSTLTYLRQLPLSELKIDRSFVQHAHLNRNDGVLVRSTIELAHDLGLKVVAEGVEDQACLRFLEQCGCDLIQGYFISRPVALSQLLELLDQRLAMAV